MLSKCFSFLFYAFCLFGICIFFTSCTNVDKKDCSKTHWPTQGFEDGREGRASRVSMFLAKCSPFNIQVDSTSYLDSYEKGLDKFCSDESAFSRGFQGLSPEAVCSNKPVYKQNYISGKNSFCNLDLGKNEALAGKPLNTFCEGKTDYTKGYNQSLKTFCSSENAYKNGFKGNKASTICIGDLEKLYLSGFKKGRLDFLKNESLKLKKEIKTKEDYLSQIKDKYTEALAEAYDLPKTSEDLEIQSKITAVDKKIKDLRENKSKAEEEIFNLQKLINANNLEVSQLEAP